MVIIQVYIPIVMEKYNGNGIPDENETDSIGYYSVSYIGDTQITDEECASYNVGEYQYIQTEMDLETLKAKLNN